MSFINDLGGGGGSSFYDLGASNGGGEQLIPWNWIHYFSLCPAHRQHLDDVDDDDDDDDT